VYERRPIFQNTSEYLDFTTIRYPDVNRDHHCNAAVLLVRNMLLLFKGYAAGPRHNQGDSGSNYLCLPEDPQWKTYLAGSQGSNDAGYIAGIEYQLVHSGPPAHSNVFSKSNNGGDPLYNNPGAVCCLLRGRSVNSPRGSSKNTVSRRMDHRVRGISGV